MEAQFWRTWLRAIPKLMKHRYNMKCMFTILISLMFSITKNFLFPQLPCELNAETLGKDREALLAAEVMDDMVAQMLMDGLADGTLILSDMDSTHFEDGECFE